MQDESVQDEPTPKDRATHDEDRPKRPLGMRAWEAVIEERIQQAQRAGQFDNLPGWGKPLSDLGDVHDQDWWLRRKLRDEGVSILPAGLEILKDIELTLGKIWELKDESHVRRSVLDLNERIRKANRSVDAGPPSTALPLDVDEIVGRWRRQRSGNA